MEFRDLKAQYKKHEKEIDDAIKSVLINADFIGGSEVKLLEKRLAEYVGVKHCITCGNGTDAMSLVLMAWDIKEGDAVFVPDFTFFATAEVVALRGATPIFVDVDEDTFNMDYKDLEIKIKEVVKENVLNPKVIIPVDLFGLPANYPKIEKIAKKYSLKILEDGAQGFGGSINGKKACSFGDAATTSFFPAKPLGCYGDGGAIFTNNDELANLVKSLAVHGKGQDKYDNVRIGVNSRLDTLQAAILNVKLTAFIERELKDINEVAKKYYEGLENTVKTPFIPNEYISSFAQYTIQLKDKSERDALKKYLSAYDIPTMIYYSKPMRKQTAFINILKNPNSISDSDILSNTVLSLPIHPYMNDDDIKKIAVLIEKFMKD
jgi:dTDP-4-amino-4,6-dideoxygalactose transaminase